MNAEHRKNILTQFFDLYTLITVKQFRDKVEGYSLNTDIVLLRSSKAIIDAHSLKNKLKLETRKVRAHQQELHFIIENQKLRLDKKNCTCPHALSGKLCEHLTVALSFIFEKIKTDEELLSLFLDERFVELPSTPIDQTEFDVLVHTMSKKELIDFIYSLETDEPLFHQIEIYLRDFLNENQS